MILPIIFSVWDLIFTYNLENRMDIKKINQIAWDHEVEIKNEWTQPVSSSIIEQARMGEWRLRLTPVKSVPKNWFPPIKNCRILCLASAGGQQAAVLAAAGARVTVFDLSRRQLDQDHLVAQRENLDLNIVQGDMTELSAFSDDSFDLIFHPVSNCFIPRVRPVWRETYRLLKKGGFMLSGFNNPAMYMFDYNLVEKQSILQVKYPLPYSDAKDLAEEDKQRYLQEKIPFEFSHSLQDQIGGQVDAGFIISGFYEDYYPKKAKRLLSDYMPMFIATRAAKL